MIYFTFDIKSFFFFSFFDGDSFLICRKNFAECFPAFLPLFRKVWSSVMSYPGNMASNQPKTKPMGGVPDPICLWIRVGYLSFDSNNTQVKYRYWCGEIDTLVTVFLS